MKPATAVAIVFAFIAPAEAKEISSVISTASSLVEAQQNKDLNEIRALDVQLNALGNDVATFGWRAVEPLSRAALDERRPLKLRLWLVAYLQRLRDPAAFAPLKALALDPSQPDLLREAAVSALAANPVSPHTRRQALCALLDAAPGENSLATALLELETLGCEDPAVLARWALAYGSRPKGQEQTRAVRAIAALGRSRPLSAVQELDALYIRFERGSPGRLKALEALSGRPRDLRLKRDFWALRAERMLAEEDGFSRNTQAALKLVGAVGGAAQSQAAARFLKDRDGAVVVAAAETLAALEAREQAPALAALLETYHQDERFAAGPGRDPVGWYERLGAALKSLQR